MDEDDFFTEEYLNDQSICFYESDGWHCYRDGEKVW